MRLQPVGLDFAAGAPYACIHDADIAAAPAAVFDVLADLENWPRRFGPATQGEWITSAPHGIGAVRAVQVGALYLAECFVAWEPGRRFAFTVIEANVPFARAMLEDWQITPTRQGSRVTYAIYYAPPLLLRPFAAAITRRLDRTAQATLATLKRSVEEG
jgi:ribosome-associated toxin RatA of RatAB toxin-antitoxin module